MATFRGTNLKNKLTGGAFGDTLLGLGGNDTLLGNSGADTLKGGTGNDTMDGGTGADKLSGEAGNDIMKGGSGNDKLDGGTGNDRLDGGANNDALTGGLGNDVIVGGTGVDTAFFAGLASASAITQSGTSLIISGANGVDVVGADVEFVRFADGVFSAAARTVTLSAATDLAPATTGSLRNDTYVGSVDTGNPAATTFNTGDNLDGAIGAADRLNLALSGNGTLTLTGTQLANIEIVQAQNTGVNATGTIFNAALWNGITNIIANGSLEGSNTRFIELTGLATATMQGGNAGNLSLSYGTGVLDGLADVQKLVLFSNAEGTGATDFSTFEAKGNGGAIAETLEITSNQGTLFRNTVRLDLDNNHQTINILGAGRLDLNLDGETSVTTMNAGAYTGTLDALSVFNIGASVIAITGSGADDQFLFSSDSVTSTDTIDGGVGTDTLGFLANTVLVDADLAGVTSIEKLGVGHPTTAPTSLDLTLGANALAMGLQTVSAFDNGQVNLTIDATFTGPLLVNLDGTDSGDVQYDGADSVDGSAMTGTLTIQALASSVDGGEVYAGGASTTDMLKLRADGGTAVLAAVSGFENVIVEAGFDATADIEIVLGSPSVVPTGPDTTLFVDASALINTEAQLFFDGSDEFATVGGIKVLGGSGADEITGGDGNDELIGAIGNDELYGGFGNDKLDGGAGNDAILAGVGGGPGLGDEIVSGDAGDDVIAFNAAELTAADTIDGGADNDTLLIVDGGMVDDVQLDGIVANSVEVLASVYVPEAIDNGLSVNLGTHAQAAGIRTVTSGSAANDTITFGAAFVSTVTVNIGAGDDYLDAGATTADVTVRTDASDVTGADTLTGGSNAGDVLALVAGGTATLTNVSGFESITFSGTAATDLVLGTAAGFGDAIAINSASMSGGLSLDATAFTPGNAITLTAGSGDDAVLVTATSLSAAYTINGGGQATITGDVLELVGGDIILDSAFTNVTNFETLRRNVGAATLLDTQAYNGGAGIKRVVGTAGSDAITIGTAFTGAITVDLFTDTGGTDDVIVTSGGAATLTIEASSADIGPLDTFTGGSGSGDTLILHADAGNADVSDMKKIETITVVAGSALTLGITVGANTVGTGETLTVNAGALTSLTNALVFNGFAEVGGLGAFIVTGTGGDDSILGGEGSDTVHGGNGADLIDGGAGSGADTLNGNDGDDTITGNDGNDAITGGNGNDKLLGGDGTDTIDGGANDDDISGGNGNDTITAGTGADDIVVVGNGTLSGLSGSSSTLDGAVANGLDTITLTADTSIDRVIFDRDIAASAVSVITGFNFRTSTTSEDVFVVETGSTWASGTEHRQTSGLVASSKLIILDNNLGGFSSFLEAGATAESLMTAPTDGTSYVYVWNDTLGAINVSYGEVSTTNPDSFSVIAKLTGVSLANVNFADFDFIA